MSLISACITYMPCYMVYMRFTKPCPNQSDYSIPSSCALTRKIHVLGMYLGGGGGGGGSLACIFRLDG